VRRIDRRKGDVGRLCQGEDTDMNEKPAGTGMGGGLKATAGGRFKGRGKGERVKGMDDKRASGVGNTLVKRASRGGEGRKRSC
jgi:hypothetical protein